MLYSNNLLTNIYLGPPLQIKLYNTIICKIKNMLKAEIKPALSGKHVTPTLDSTTVIP